MSLSNTGGSLLVRTDSEAVYSTGEEAVTFARIVDAYRVGATAEEIAARHPDVPLADVYTLIGHYLRHQNAAGDDLDAPEQAVLSSHDSGLLSLLRPRLVLLQPLLSVLLLGWLPVLLLYTFAAVLTSTGTVTVRQLTQDATTVLDAPFYIGSISTFANIVWAIAATVCLYTPLFLSQWIGKPWQRFLLFSGLFTLLLLFDDAFLLHDDILPNYLGISGEVYGVTYVLIILFYLFRFRYLILRSNYLLLGIALGCFGVSASVDLSFDFLRDIFAQRLVLLVEDGAKLLGIVTWLSYFVHLTSTLLPSGRTLGASRDGRS